MRIQEMFNVTDGHGRNFGVDFLFLFFDFYRLIFSITDVSHINMLPYQTPGISNQALVFMRCENVHITDGHFGKKCNF